MVVWVLENTGNSKRYKKGNNRQQNKNKKENIFLKLKIMLWLTKKNRNKLRKI